MFEINGSVPLLEKWMPLSLEAVPKMPPEKSSLVSFKEYQRVFMGAARLYIKMAFTKPKMK